jgi:zinc D-Ala-D-Ala carboxypeptidase
MKVQKSFGDVKYFTDDELACPCCGALKMDPRFLELLLKFRGVWDKPMIVNSAFRCTKHNKEIGGEPKSRHLSGEAGDFRVIPFERFAFVKLAMKVGFTGIGVGKDFIHLQTGNVLKLWSY